MRIFLIIVAIVVIALLLFYYFYGGFKKVEVKTSQVGGETLVYEKLKGDYRQSGDVMDKIYKSLLEEDKIETFKGFGIYYDNPKIVEKEKLRSEAGCIIEEKDLVKLSETNDKYNIKVFPTKEYITAEFPYKGKLSVVFSILKVYPALGKYAVENRYDENTSVMEIYDVPNKKIYYRKELVRK